jgi:hypothetical protein
MSFLFFLFFYFVFASFWTAFTFFYYNIWSFLLIIRTLITIMLRFRFDIHWLIIINPKFTHYHCYYKNNEIIDSNFYRLPVFLRFNIWRLLFSLITVHIIVVIWKPTILFLRIIRLSGIAIN